MTDTEQLAHLVKRILGNKEMYGGEDNNQTNAEKIINSLSVEDFDTENTKDSENNSFSDDETNYNYNSDSDDSSSDSDESNDFLNKRNVNMEDKEYNESLSGSNSSSTSSSSSSNSSSSDSSSSSSFSSVSDSTTEEYKTNRFGNYFENSDNKTDSYDGDNELAYPKCLRNARLSNIGRKTDFIEKLKDKFPNLSSDGNKSQIMQLFRFIFREVNKQHPELQENSDNFDEDKIFDYAEKYLDKLNDSNIDFKIISDYDIDKKKRRNLYMKMLWKIHKINPKLSYGKKTDNKVYDTVVIRSVAIRKGKELYKDSNLSQYDFMKKVYKLITPEFVNSVDIDKEIEFYKSLNSINQGSKQSISTKSKSASSKAKSESTKKTTKSKKK